MSAAYCFLTRVTRLSDESSHSDSNDGAPVIEVAIADLGTRSIRVGMDRRDPRNVVQSAQKFRKIAEWQALLGLHMRTGI
jgi:hypothetical protein